MWRRVCYRRSILSKSCELHCTSTHFMERWQMEGPACYGNHVLIKQGQLIWQLCGPTLYRLSFAVDVLGLQGGRHTK